MLEIMWLWWILIKKLCAGTKTHVDVSLLNCVIFSKSVFVAEWWCLQWINVRCWIVLSVANQVFVVELWCLQQIRFSLSNCVVCNESGVHCWIMVSAANQVFVAELCCLQRISFCRQMVITVSPANQFTDNSVFQRISPLTNLHHYQSVFTN